MRSVLGLRWLACRAARQRPGSGRPRCAADATVVEQVGQRVGDLAMLALFGYPHLDTVLAAYDEAAPLGDGWRARVALHQLFPLLVHTVLFGGGYGVRTGAAARAALRAG